MTEQLSLHLTVLQRERDGWEWKVRGKTKSWEEIRYLSGRKLRGGQNPEERVVVLQMSQSS